MVSQSAAETIANARKTTRNDVGMCLWYSQEWAKTPHRYPDASSQWANAKYKHPGDRNPPPGAPVSWTGGAKGYGHSAISVGGGRIRTIDQQRPGTTTEVAIGEIERDWGLTYKGWHEDLGGVRLPYLIPGGQNPDNPNGVKVGDTALVTANGALNGREAPDSNAKVLETRNEGDAFVVTALEKGWAKDDNAWYSTDYLYPKVASPKNPNRLKKGDTVLVTSTTGLRAREMPGGPVSEDKKGKPIVREKGWRMTITADPKDGWVTGGQNWYSSDYLAPAPTEPNPPAKLGWKPKPRIVLPLANVPKPVSYLQAGVRVDAVTSDAGSWPEVWVIAQDVNNEGNTRFLLYDAQGKYLGWMMVRGGGHGQTFHAYRSAAGKVYIWTLIGSVAYRILWQSGATITASSAGVERMSYGKGRPVGTYESFIAFRTATDTMETFTLHSRYGFTDPAANSSKPFQKVTIPKRTNYTQQSWAVSRTRIYRFMGKTNENAGSGSRKHILDVFDWSGKLLLDRMDLTDMHQPGASEDEPEGLTFGGTPGAVYAGKREGPNVPNRRNYVWWELTGLP